MSGWVIALAGAVILYGLTRMLTRAPASQTTAATAPASSDAAPPDEPAPKHAQAASTRQESKLTDQPDVADIDHVDLEASIYVPAQRRDMTDLLIECGALDRQVRDQNERSLPESPDLVIGVPLREIPTDVLARLWENPVDTLEISAHIKWRKYGYIHGEFGTIAHIEQAFDKWLEASPGWQSMVQERGAYIDGTFFTADVLLHIERGYMDSSVVVEVVSREVLRRDVRRQLAELRAHLQTPIA
ncbi:hypothetical protein C5O80_27350 [Burkholderia sp. SRS-46]|nr:hypothetical protein C5O80_27350 [Burkholderia sp. SRS-46]